MSTATPEHIGWTSVVGPLPVSILSRPPAACPPELSEAPHGEDLAGVAAAGRPGQAYIILNFDAVTGPDGYGATVVCGPCSLCAAAGGTGCESLTCRRPA